MTEGSCRHFVTSMHALFGQEVQSNLALRRPNTGRVSPCRVLKG
jgi:hypothetical protein